VPSVDSVSGLFVFVLYLVCPVLTKIQDGNKQSRDTVNTGHTRYRKKTNNPETLSTLGTQDRGRKQTIQRHCEHWAHKIQDGNKQSRDTVNSGHTRYRKKTNNPETL
jgi:hypothetical protein